MHFYFSVQMKDMRFTIVHQQTWQPLVAYLICCCDFLSQIYFQLLPHKLKINFNVIFQSMPMAHKHHFLSLLQAKFLVLTSLYVFKNNNT
jgi:hypothetical protein